MKDANAQQKTSDDSLECANHVDKLNATEIGQIMDIAGKDSAIDHSEIRALTKIILKIDPIEVDESLQAKFSTIMNKVRAQYA